MTTLHRVHAPLLPPAPCRGPGSGRRPGRRHPPVRPAPHSWPGAPAHRAGELERFTRYDTPGDAPPLTAHQVRLALTAARTVYAAYDHLTVAVGVDAVPAPSFVRRQASWAATRAVFGDDAPAHSRYRMHRAMTRAGLLP
ncbi:hypothetical protein [Actinomycetospora termitidis]|uniref:Uncharacterized protein n=1 Tax=Actinomycetospora termitidis TaxID=3053470 RepID=A0ABT7MIK2_9PSEU|nr:hypothetical protein [Actinomycetospora sp. Odt1-22]MDL5160506.1 hypothetical protein [Actinomycetospora sp. Odt1-22]